MRSLLLLASFISVTSIALGLTTICNEENDLTIFTSNNCQKYYLCIGGKLIENSCKPGKAFLDYKYGCVDASLFTCEDELEGNELGLGRKKRSATSVHSISKSKAKESALHLLMSIKTDIMDALKEVAPSVHDSLEANYIPMLKSIKNDFMPVVKKSVLPKVEKAYAYGKNLSDRVFEKVHQSLELSNSTHINIVSFSDIASDVSKDLKPIIQLGKYFSSRLSTRPKRQIFYRRSFFDTVANFVQPIATNIFKRVSSMAAANDPFLRDYVLPMVYVMMDDPRTMAEIREIIFIGKRIYGPIVSEFFRGQRYRNFNGASFRPGSNPVLNEAKFRMFNAVQPYAHNIIERHLQMILYRTGVHLPLITDTLQRIASQSGPEVMDLKHDLVLFFAKHSEYFMTNDNSFRNVHTFTAMKQDLIPIKKNFLKVAVEYLSHSPNSFLRSLFGRNSFLNRFL